METVSSDSATSVTSDKRRPSDASQVTRNGDADLDTRHPSTVTLFFKQTWAVTEKDFRSEFRTRYALNAVLLFAVTAMTVVAMSVATPDLNARARAALLWTVVFFAAMSGLHRTFVREEETRTADALRLSVPSAAVFMGKWFFNFGLLLALQAIISILFIVFMHADITRLGLYAASFLVGDVGLVTVCTFMAALVAKARTRGALYAVICFPVLVPMLYSAVVATGISLGEPARVSAMAALQVLISYAGLMLTVSLMLFDLVWRE